jgi:hypothetical protein
MYKDINNSKQTEEKKERKKADQYTHTHFDLSSYKKK